MQVLDPVSLALILLAMSIVPFVAIVITSYTKIVVVLGLLRNALGVQQVPPNMVLNGIDAARLGDRAAQSGRAQYS